MTKVSQVQAGPYYARRTKHSKISISPNYMLIPKPSVLLSPNISSHHHPQAQSQSLPFSPVMLYITIVRYLSTTVLHIRRCALQQMHMVISSSVAAKIRTYLNMLSGSKVPEGQTVV